MWILIAQSAIVIVSGIAANLIAGWFQQDIWSNVFTRGRIISTVVVAVITTSLSSCIQGYFGPSIPQSEPTLSSHQEVGVDRLEDGTVIQAGRDVIFAVPQVTPDEKPISMLAPRPEPSNVPPERLPTPAPDGDWPAGRRSIAPTFTLEEHEVKDVILQEVAAVIHQDLFEIQKLYAPSAIVIDARGTGDDISDDFVYKGWNEIKLRYLAYFRCCAYNFTVVELDVKVNGDRATGIHKGIEIEGKYYREIASYELQKINGRWLITQLTHNVR